MKLSDRANERLEALSKGNQQKVQFISAILHRPAFAILDEPFSGLDPLNQEFFSTLIRELRDDGMTILLSAHQMQVVEKLADRVLLMNRGSESLVRDNGRDSAQDKIGFTTWPARAWFGRSRATVRGPGRSLRRIER